MAKKFSENLPQFGAASSVTAEVLPFVIPELTILAFHSHRLGIKPESTLSTLLVRAKHARILSEYDKVVSNFEGTARERRALAALYRRAKEELDQSGNFLLTFINADESDPIRKIAYQPLASEVDHYGIIAQLDGYANVLADMMMLMVLPLVALAVGVNIRTILEYISRLYH